MIKPIIISHRGNFLGPEPKLENRLDYLWHTIRHKQVKIEFDAWYYKGQWALGHDEPQYGVRFSNIWKLLVCGNYMHCKNLEALQEMTNRNDDLWEGRKRGYRFFWHQNDDYTLTSNGKIWTYPGKKVSKDSILVDLSKNPNYNIKCYGVCVDFLPK